MTPVLFGLAAAPLTREGAREAARRELSKPPYHRDDPSLVEEAFRALGRWVTELFDRAAAAGPGSRLGTLLLLVLLGVVLVAIRLRVGPLARRGAAPSPLLDVRPRTASEYRRAATAAAAAGDYAAALRDRLRALAAEVEARGIVEPRAGRTADELVRELTRALITVDGRLPATVVAFDQVWYGGRPAVPGDYELAVAADEALIADLNRPRSPAFGSASGSAGGR